MDLDRRWGCGITSYVRQNKKFLRFRKPLGFRFIMNIKILCIERKRPLLTRQAFEDYKNRFNSLYKNKLSITFPHTLIPIVLIEQIYRVWSIQQNHPYHR